MAPLQARNQQQCVEGGDEVVRLLHGLDQTVAIGGTAAGIAQGSLGAVAQPRERRLEIMRDIVGDLAQRQHQFLDAGKHGIETLRQAIQLVAGPAEGNAARKIAGHDLAAGFGDGIDAAKHAPADQDAGTDAQHRQQADAPQGDATHGERKLPLILDVPADDECQPAADRNRLTHSQTPINPGAAGGANVGEHLPLTGVGKLRRQHGQIAGNLAAGRVEQKIEVRARFTDALVDGRDEARRAAGLELLAQCCNLGRHGFDGPGGQKRVRLPGDEPDDQGRRRRRRRPCRQPSAGTGWTK